MGTYNTLKYRCAQDAMANIRAAPIQTWVIRKHFPKQMLYKLKRNSYEEDENDNYFRHR